MSRSLCTYARSNASGRVESAGAAAVTSTGRRRWSWSMRASRDVIASGTAFCDAGCRKYGVNTRFPLRFAVRSCRSRTSAEASGRTSSLVVAFAAPSS